MTYRSTTTRSGFSLIEVLMAVMILGIGIISIASLFPAGIAQQRATNDDVMGPIVARNAIAVIRAKLTPTDFGTFEEFGPDIDKSVPLFAAIDRDATQAYQERSLPMTFFHGDWPWLRPGAMTGNDSEGDPDDYCWECGGIDIFSARYRGLAAGVTPWFDDALSYSTEFPSGQSVLNFDDEEVLYGIPFNTNNAFTDPSGFPVPPEIIITQQERFYPQPTASGFNADGFRLTPPKPQYVWDCMFRRYHGQIQVAVFVYRVNSSGVDQYIYAMPRVPGDDTQLPVLPHRMNLLVHDNGDVATGAWSAYDFSTSDPVIDAARVQGTVAGAEYNVFDPDQSWQEPQQWLIDQNLKVHRILDRFRDDTGDPVDVTLVRPIAPVTAPSITAPTSPLATLNISVNFVEPWTGTSIPPFIRQQGVVTDIWYIPNEVTTESPAGDINLTLTPVYATVFEL